jgi:hypothetical protein
MIIVWVILCLQGETWQQRSFQYTKKADCESMASYLITAGQPSVCRERSVSAPPSK